MGLVAKDRIGFLMNERESENELGQVHEMRLRESVVLCVRNGLGR